MTKQHKTFSGAEKAKVTAAAIRGQKPINWIIKSESKLIRFFIFNLKRF